MTSERSFFKTSGASFSYLDTLGHNCHGLKPLQTALYQYENIIFIVDWKNKKTLNANLGIWRGEFWDKGKTYGGLLRPPIRSREQNRSLTPCKPLGRKGLRPLFFHGHFTDIFTDIFGKSCNSE